MKLEDIIALAKQGYKPSDIKELVALAEPDNSDNDQEDTDNNHTEEDGDTHERDEATHQGKEDQEDTVDYKKLYEEEKAKNDKIQKENRKKDVSGQEDDNVDPLLELARSFM